MLLSSSSHQVLIATTELAMPTGIPTNEATAKKETQPLTAEMKIRKCSKQIKALHTLLCFSLIKSLCFISSKISFLVSSIFSV